MPFRFLPLATIEIAEPCTLKSIAAADCSAAHGDDSTDSAAAGNDDDDAHVDEALHVAPSTPHAPLTQVLHFTTVSGAVEALLLPFHVSWPF